MRVFVAGASGVIGMRLVPLLVEAGHEVAGLTRTPSKRDLLRRLGAEPVVCDVFDVDALQKAVAAFGPDVMIHQLTDLPDDAARIPEFMPAHNRIRRDGTRILAEVARAVGTTRFLAQSIAWELEGDAQAAVEELERLVLDAGGVVLRYGQFYGPGTYYEAEPPSAPRVHVDEAARRTVQALETPSGSIETIVDPTGS